MPPRLPFLRFLPFGFRRPGAGGAARSSPLPRLDLPVWVVGDVHGRADLLAAMLDLAGAERVVLAGDLIDRGPDSATVLARMLAAARSGDPARLTCLMGNHERMLLDALDAPARHGARWLAAGGDATLASLGIDPRRSTDPWPSGLAPALRAALPAGTEAWLRALPQVWQEGGLAVTHAGADPARAITAQTETALLWGHRDFGRVARSDGLWIAHGHVIVPEPVATGGRIAVDTGAWTTGRLSAARIGPEGVSFHSVTA